MPGQCNCVLEICDCNPRIGWIMPRPDDEVEQDMLEKARELFDQFRENAKPTILTEPARVTPVRSLMTWICRNGHRVVFWRDHCDTCGAGAHGFDDTSGVGFPD